MVLVWGTLFSTFACLKQFAQCPWEPTHLKKGLSLLKLNIYKAIWWTTYYVTNFLILYKIGGRSRKTRKRSATAGSEKSYSENANQNHSWRWSIVPPWKESVSHGENPHLSRKRSLRRVRSLLYSSCEFKGKYLNPDQTLRCSRRLSFCWWQHSTRAQVEGKSSSDHGLGGIGCGDP